MYYPWLVTNTTVKDLLQLIQYCSNLCTDLSGKEPHRQVGVGKVVTSRSLGDIMVSTLAWNARDVGCRLNISLFHHPNNTALTRILYKLCTVWLLSLPCICTVKPL